jgi:hypothetical protein
MKSKLLILAVVFSLGFCCVKSVVADQVFWNEPTGGAFDDPNSWLPMFVPGINDDPIFNVPDTYTVSFPVLSVATTGPLSVVDGDVTFSLGQNFYTVVGDVGIGGGLTISEGNLEAVGEVNLLSGGVLRGDGTVSTSLLSINTGGELRGSLIVNTITPGGGLGVVVNSGTVAPRDLSGTSEAMLRINGDYVQNAMGLLDVRVDGTSPMGRNDRLVITGTTSLAGRLNVPFLGGDMPAVGNNFTLLSSPQGGRISGEFDSIRLPDYQSSPIAVRLDYLADSALLNFVAPTSVSSASGIPTSLWGSPSTWMGEVPITSDVVDLVNSTPAATRLDLEIGTTASRRAFAHVVNLSALNATATNTLGIPSGTSLSAISRVNVGENGIVEMSGGNVVTNVVQVNGDGMILGNGTIDGDVVLGTGSADGEASLNPNSPGSASGVINASNLTINSDGVFAVSIEDVNSFGQVVVEQTATQGGRLVIDASNYAAPIGTSFTVMTSDTIESHFDSVETVGSSTTFFAQPPTPTLAGLGGDAYEVQSYSIGDMNLDNSVDSDDAPDFVLGLLDPVQYWLTHGFMFPVQAGNFYPGSSFDFDDVEGFTNAVEGLEAADIYALIDQMSVPEPTTGGLLLLACSVLGTTSLRRLSYSARRSV